jgi:hypothetical protein
MATRKSRRLTSSKSKKSGGRHRALKTAAVLAAIGVATVAVAKGLKTPKGRALKQKALTKGRKVLRQVKSVARASTGRGRRMTTSPAS